MPQLVPLLLALALLPGAALAATSGDCPGNPAALGTARTIAIDTTAPLAIGLKTYPQTLDLADREVVLTFDDGPRAGTTPRVLDALEHDCIHAAFFLIGRNAAAAPALVRREVADGDTVGHHTWSHPAITERGLSDDAARADIQHGFEADDRAAYGAAAAEPRVAFFRFPGFADTKPLLAWLGARHVAVFGTDIWASDWLKQTPKQELALVMERLNKDGRGIILLHDAREQTAAMMPDLVQALKAGGYRIVAIVPGPGPTPLRPAPPGWTSETERIVEAIMPKLLARKARPTLVGLKPMTLPVPGPVGAPSDTVAPATPPPATP